MWAVESLPAHSNPKDMVSGQLIDADDSLSPCYIIALTKTARMAIFLAVVVPKLCIACYLLYMGLQWLTSGNSYTGLILDALSLQFIVQLDEILFDALYPHDFKDMIEGSTVLVPEAHQTKADKNY